MSIYELKSHNNFIFFDFPILYFDNLEICYLNIDFIMSHY